MQSHKNNWKNRTKEIDQRKLLCAIVNIAYATQIGLVSLLFHFFLRFIIALSLVLSTGFV